MIEVLYKTHKKDTELLMGFFIETYADGTNPMVLMVRPDGKPFTMLMRDFLELVQFVSKG